METESYFNMLLERAIQSHGQLLEMIITEVYSMVLPEGSVAIDGGANGGLHTLPLSRIVGKTGRIIAIEPLPRIVKILQERLETAGASNVIVIDKAISADEGKGEFFEVMEDFALSGLLTTQNAIKSGGDINKLNVQITTIDTLVREFVSFGNVRFIKLDLEGGEFHALQGAIQTIRKHRPLIIFEHGRTLSTELYNYTLNDFFNFFEQYSLNVYDIFGRPFGPADWYGNNIPWNYIASLKDSPEDYFIKSAMDRLIGTVLSRCT